MAKNARKLSKTFRDNVRKCSRGKPVWVKRSIYFTTTTTTTIGIIVHNGILIIQDLSRE